MSQNVPKTETASIIINANDLKGVFFLNSIIDKKSPYNSIRNIQITNVSKDILRLCATNLEIFMIKEIVCKNIKNLPEIKIKSNILCDCLKKISGEIELKVEANKINIIDNSGKFVLVNCEEKYPEENIDNMEFLASLEEQQFINAIKSVSINVNPQDKGVCRFSINNNQLSVIVYDKKRICFCTTELKEFIKNFDCMISPKYIKELKKIKGNIKLYYGSKRLMIESDDGKMIIKTIEGNNIDHLKFVRDLKESCSVNLSDLKSSVERCLINVQPNGINKLKFQCFEESLIISYYDYVEDSYATQTIGCKCNIPFSSDDTRVFYLNGLQVLDMLKNIHTQEVQIFYNENLREVIFKGFAYYVNIKLTQIK